MKITAGIYKGRTLFSPKGDLTRPTSEKLRAAIFNICQQKIIDAHFLDLFAGSGAMGLEALSRGAAHATFIDQSKESIITIRKNIENLNVKESSTLLASDAFKALSLYEGPPFDILYIDPPYASAAHLLLPLFGLLDQHSSLCNPDAWIFVEEDAHAPTHLTSQTFQHITLYKERKVGTTTLLHFCKNKIDKGNSCESQKN